MAQQRPQRDLSGLALLTGGFVLVTISVGGYFIGTIIDSRLGTAPTGAIIGLVLGTIIGFWDFYRIASRIMRQQPVPTRQQQKTAEEEWEKSEKSVKYEGDRDENHE